MHVSPIVLDLETVGLPNAADFLEPVQAAKNLRDPEKIRADIEQRTIERDAKVALDWNVGRIACLGWWTEEHGTVVLPCQDEAHEGAAIGLFWQESKHRTIVGFNIAGFDLRYLIQRSRYLGLQYPRLDLGKYAKQGVTDLFLDLTFRDGHYDSGAMRRTLKAFARRFGIPVTDDIDGKDIEALIAAAEWDQVTAHCRSDVELTVALARKLGVVQPEAVGVL